MNTPIMTTKGKQTKDQFIAAALAQLGEHGLHTTTRGIATQTGQNIAAITYYFGSKEDLYLVCAQWTADSIGAQFRPRAEEAERLFAQPEPDRGVMREPILCTYKSMIMLLTQDDIVNLSKFIPCERLSPTATCQLVHDQVINPLHTHLTRLIAAYTGGGANDTQMILYIHTTLGEVLAFRLGKETILLRTGWLQFDEDKTALINQTITCHIDLILQGLMQKSLESWKNLSFSGWLSRPSLP